MSRRDEAGPFPIPGLPRISMLGRYDALAVQPPEPATVIVFKRGPRIMAKWGATSELITKSDRLNDVLNEVLEQIGEYGWANIYIKRGAYLIDEPIRIAQSAVTFWGSGPKSTVLRLADGANCNMFEFTGTETIFFVCFRYLSLYGNKENNTSGNGIYAPLRDSAFMSDVHVEYCYILEFPEDGLYIGNPWGWRLDHCVIEFNGGAGVHVPAGEDFRVIGCKINRNGTGLKLGTNGANIIGNHIRGNKGYGVDLHYTNTVSYTHLTLPTTERV